MDVDEISDSFFNGQAISLIGIHGRYECSQAILATGFAHRRPGNGFIDQAIHELGLKTFSCGFPVIGKNLRTIRGHYPSFHIPETIDSIWTILRTRRIHRALNLPDRS